MTMMSNYIISNITYTIIIIIYYERNKKKEKAIRGEMT